MGEQEEVYDLMWHDNLLRRTTSLKEAEEHLTDENSHYRVIINGEHENSVYWEEPQLDAE
jgi:hypothetical protein